MGEGLFSPIHMGIVLLIVFFLFGAKKLPDLGKSMGTGIREFKKGLSELHTELDDDAPAAAAPGTLDAAAPTADDVVAQAGVESPEVVAQ